MKLYPNVQCSICPEWVDPASAYWIATEYAQFDGEGWPRLASVDLEPVCDDCALRLLLDKDTPRHALKRPRQPDSK